MNFTLTLNAHSMDELVWLLTVLSQKADKAMGAPPNGADGEAAPEAGEAVRKRGRPRKDDQAKVQADLEAQAAASRAAQHQAATANVTAPAVPSMKPKGMPALQPLKDAITTHARLAMRGEGDKKILELLPAFRDATGLDFVMNAEEQHREALYELAIAAGVPLA